LTLRKISHEFGAVDSPEPELTLVVSHIVLLESVEISEFRVVIQVPVIGYPSGDALVSHGDMTFTSESLSFLKPGIGKIGLGLVVKIARPESFPFLESSFSVLSTSVPECVVVSQEEVELISLKMSLELVHNLIPIYFSGFIGVSLIKHGLDEGLTLLTAEP